MSRNNTNRLEIRLPQERRAELDAIAQQMGLSVSALVKLGISRLISEERKQGRAA
jgi:antitoxin component of RelBE/YafQ-DinJ toxin-antitoxin module